MNNNLTNINQGNQFDIFNYKNLGSVRCYVDQQGAKWFCLNDVCNILTIVNPNDALRRLDSKGVVLTDTLTNGGMQQLNFINEGNLFRLITGSRKPEAREFTNWVCDTVLPSLMNKGYYTMKEVTPATILIEVGKQLLDHEKRFANIDNTLIAHKQEISDNRIMAQEVQRIQRQLIETGYISVKSFIVYHNLDTNTFDPAHLGRTASHICNSQGILMGNEPSDNWNFVNTYPYQVIFEAYQKIMFNKVNN